MNHPSWPETEFIDPFGGNREQVEGLAREILDRLVAELSRATRRPPLPEASDAAFDEALPERGDSPQALLDRLDAVIQGAMNPAHPGYIGHMDSMPTLMSTLGDLVSSALNNNMLSAEMSPALTQLERQLTRHWAQEFGLGADAGGVLCSGGSLANLHALAVARNRAFDAQARGITDQPSQPVILASDAAHTSLHKAAMLLGLGTEAVIPVTTTADAQMDVDELERTLRQSKQAGQIPFAVVATAGTTTTGNLDPLMDIADVAQREGLWLHVDAAYGGALIVSQRCANLLAGIERADSITFNPQKWLYVAKTCAMALFRDMAAMTRAFRVSAPYMRGDDETPNLGEIGVQGTRHADVLKLWLTMRHLGRQGLAALIEQSQDLTRYVVSQIQARPALELAAKPETNVVCFRLAPYALPDRDVDAAQERLQQFLLREHEIFLSLPRFRGARWLRAVLLNPYTDRERIDQLFAGVDAFHNAVSP